MSQAESLRERTGRAGNSALRSLAQSLSYRTHSLDLILTYAGLRNWSPSPTILSRDRFPSMFIEGKVAAALLI